MSRARSTRAGSATERVGWRQLACLPLLWLPLQSAPVGASEPDASLSARIHDAFFERTSTSGRHLGLDELDPLLWPDSRYLFEPARARRCRALLEETLAHPDEVRALPALERAWMQRDLWAVRDWLHEHAAGVPPPAAELERLILATMRLIALEAQEIEALSDGLEAGPLAGHPHSPPGEPDEDAARLLQELLAPDGPWLRIGRELDAPAAPLHVRYFGGRSLFSVHLRLPGDRAATRTFLEQLASSEQATRRVDEGYELRPDLPQLPVGTQVALLRRMMLLDGSGEPHPSGLVESLQLRRYLALPRVDDLEPAGRAQEFQEFQEFESRRADSSAGVGRLRALRPGEPSFPRFGSHGFDPLQHEAVASVDALATCIHCHGQPGTYSLASLTGIFAPAGFEQRRTPFEHLRVETLTREQEQAAARSWLRASASFLELSEHWERP